MTALATIPNTDEELVAFFTNCDPDDPFACQQRDMNLLELQFWVDHVPDDSEDIDMAIKTISSRMGLGTQRTRSIVKAIRRLKLLPKTLKLALEMGHLNMDRIIAIDRSLTPMSDEHLGAMDSYLYDLLTPQYPREVLRQPAAIRKRITRHLTKIDPDSVQDEIDRKSGVTVHHDDVTSRMSVRLSNAEIFECQQILHRVMKDYGLTEAEAFMSIMKANSEAKITLNLIPNETGNLDILGAGALTPRQMVDWLGRVTDVRILHEHIDQHSTDRFFSTEAQMFLTARDGQCISPGCTNNAITAQGEHTENFDGANTTVGNGAKFCQHCHNQKTDGRINVISINDKGAKLCTTPDGRDHVVVPDGPLIHTTEQLLTVEEYLNARARRTVPTPHSNNWGQTIAQNVANAMKRKRKTA